MPTIDEAKSSPSPYVTQASPATEQRDSLRALLERPLLTAASRLALQGELDRATLREELRAVCAAAKLRGVKAEQVLIAVKEIWGSLPETQIDSRYARGNPILSQVVTMTLDEYYSVSNA